MRSLYKSTPTHIIFLSLSHPPPYFFFSFFFWMKVFHPEENTHLESRESLTGKRLKFIALTLRKPSPVYHTLAQEVQSLRLLT